MRGPIPVLSETELQAQGACLGLVPKAVAMRLRALPLRLEGEVLRVAMADPGDLLAQDELARVSGRKVSPARAAPEAILRAIERHYEDAPAPEEAARLMDPWQLADTQTFGEVAAEAAAEMPVASLVNTILDAAIRERASDIHVEAHASDRLIVRFRVDGVLYDHLTLGMDQHSSLVSRIKVMARMDIAERRLPQDGRFEGQARGQVFDVRVASAPGVFGEQLALRLLPKSAAALRLDELGLSSDQLQAVEGMISRSLGMVMATGPTGCGKTTTLYAALGRVDRVGQNVITLEDPIEYQISRVTQIQVNPRAGLTFASGLRHLVRQDPDVIMVGEVRDLETLQMAIQSALTGHLVLTSFHCMDAAAAAARMVDMGAEPYLVASATRAVISQRLVRRICAGCRSPEDPPAQLLRLFAAASLPEARLGAQGEGPFWRGTGCDRCRGTGYYGRTGVFEILPFDDPVQRAVIQRDSASEIRRLARSLGYLNLRDHALAAARQGVTTLEEVARAVFVED